MSSPLPIQASVNKADFNAYIYPDPRALFMYPDNSVIGDGKGGFYQFQSGSTATIDSVYDSVMDSQDPVNYPGRNVRILSLIKPVPQGILKIDGLMKTLYVTGTTDSNGECKINLTTDNTATGPSIFSSVVKNMSWSKQDASINAASNAYVKVSADSTSYKTTTHGYFKSQNTAILIGGTAIPVQSVGSGVTVMFEISGL